MPTFNNLQEAINYAKQQTQDALNKEVAKLIKDTERDHVESDVYSVFTPRIYERQMDNYGLSDERNMEVSKLGEVGIQVTNITLHRNLEDFNNVRVANIVETGRGYEYDFAYNGVPRPFQENTIDELKSSNEHITVLKEGLKKRGIDTK